MFLYGKEARYMDGEIMYKCFGLPEDFDCETCPYNIGQSIEHGGVVGPCGQQNCWYSCAVCHYNNLYDCDGEES